MSHCLDGCTAKDMISQQMTDTCRPSVRPDISKCALPELMSWAFILSMAYIIPRLWCWATDIKRNKCVWPLVERIEVILLDLFTLNYIVISAIALITGCFIKFHRKVEIPQQWVNSVVRLKILWPAENCGP